MTTDNTPTAATEAEAEAQGRILKFRTPMACPNGHFFWVPFEIVDGFPHQPNLSRSSDCKCDLWGAEKLGPALQFTGLVDKNQIEIFEGDLLERDDEPTLKAIGKVIFVEGQFAVQGIGQTGWGTLGFCIGVFHVIGNIYEHSELLESK